MKISVIKPTKIDIYNSILLIGVVVGMYKGRSLDAIIIILLGIWTQLMNIYEKIK